jgi:hypothetical protein
MLSQLHCTLLGAVTNIPHVNNQQIESHGFGLRKWHRRFAIRVLWRKEGLVCVLEQYADTKEAKTYR